MSVTTRAQTAAEPNLARTHLRVRPMSAAAGRSEAVSSGTSGSRGGSSGGGGERRGGDAKAAARAPNGSEAKSEVDYYFDSYSHFGIHEEMLKDEVRTSTYMRSILQNRHLFKGRTVLDIGCGTGILSMFAAKAGAARVIGIDCAEIIHKARKIVADNGLADTVTLIKGRVEGIDLPVKKVDIIVSEWMGYFLLYESMLDTVLYARDKWLAKGGAIFPDRATMFVAGIEDREYRESKFDFWKNVCGFDMSVVREMALQEPLVDTCDPSQLITTPGKLIDIDIYTVTKEMLDFKSRYEIKATRSEELHALVVYFSVDFLRCHKPIGFNTGPRDKYTHWKQTVFYLDQPMEIEKGDTITGIINCSRNSKNPRDLDIELSAMRHSRKYGKASHRRKYTLR